MTCPRAPAEDPGKLSNEETSKPIPGTPLTPGPLLSSYITEPVLFLNLRQTSKVFPPIYPALANVTPGRSRLTVCSSQSLRVDGDHWRLCDNHLRHASGRGLEPSRGRPWQTGETEAQREYNLIVRDVLFGFTPSLSPLAGFHTWTTLLCSSRPTFSTCFILFNPPFYSSLHSSGTMFLKSALVSLLLLTPWMFVRGTSLNTHF